MVKKRFGALVHQFFKAHDPEDRYIWVEIDDQKVIVRIYPSVDLTYDFATDQGEIIWYSEEWVNEEDRVEVVKKGILKDGVLLWSGPGPVPSWVREIFTNEGFTVLSQEE